MRDEPTIPGNPRKFTLKQHFLSAYLISQFYGDDNRVGLQFKSKNAPVRKGGRERPFFGKRVWDQCTEKSYMGKIESEFQKELECMEKFESRCHIAITRYFLLWKYRRIATFSPDNDVVINGVLGNDFLKEVEETFESKGTIFFRKEGEIPSRMNGGLFIRSSVTACSIIMSQVKWGLLRSTDGEFLVADSYDDFLFMPIAPDLAFKAGVKDATVKRNELIEINNQTISQAKIFYFSRNLSMCPI